jgi:Rps23 Pro-64 3,4-dihydroxylase Tpa1-like proline 4-hydroxylase
MNNKLIENNYLIIPNFISPERSKILSDEFKLYCEKENLSGDDQSPNSHSIYNHISFLELLCEKTPEVSTLIEETVLPTYSYARVYKEGSVLENHVDRDACEISLTLHLDGDYPWPIWIETPQKEKKFVSLNPGDAMVYLGRIAPHWREEYKGSYYSQVFLHYVRSRGECSYAYFDKEKESNLIESDKKENKTTTKEENSIVKSDQHISSITLKSTRKLEDFIKIYDNVVSADLCNKILQEYKNSQEWNKTLVGDGILNTNIRNCSVIQLSDSNIIDKNYEVRKFIDVELHQQLLKVVEMYSKEFLEFSPSIDTGYDLLMYESGQFYTQHTDSFIHQQRSVSCSLTLNDDYVGGEFAFFDREMMIRNSVGSVIVFPSNFMYPHEIMPVIEGTRYSVITWYV